MTSPQAHAYCEAVPPSLEEDKTGEVPGKREDCYSMSVKCIGCSTNSMFSACTNLALCVGCSTVLCPATGEKARPTEGCSCRGNSTQAPGPMGRYSNTHALDDQTRQHRKRRLGQWVTLGRRVCDIPQLPAHRRIFTWV